MPFSILDGDFLVHVDLAVTTHITAELSRHFLPDVHCPELGEHPSSAPVVHLPYEIAHLRGIRKLDVDNLFHETSVGNNVVAVRIRMVDHLLNALRVAYRQKPAPLTFKNWLISLYTLARFSTFAVARSAALLP